MIKINYDTTRRDKQRHRTAVLFKTGMMIFLSTVGALLLWKLKALILPTIIGALLAYIMKPLFAKLKFKFLPENLRTPFVIVLTSSFLFVFIAKLVETFPDEKELLILQTRLLYKINEKYSKLDDLQQKGELSMGMALVKKELKPVITKINDSLAFDETQTKHFLSLQKKNDPLIMKYYEMFKKNNETTAATAFEESQHVDLSSMSAAASHAGDNQGLIAKLGESGSAWLVLPLVFLFLLFDRGEILHYLFGLIPNRYFELSMSVFEEVDRAIGAYLRGTLLESAILSAFMTVGFFLVGLPFNMAILLGVLAGLTNAIPFVGLAFGLVGGLAYALIAENVHPLIPGLSEEHVYIGVVAVVFIAHLVDNFILQPIVLGGAVNLHPLVVAVGILGGSILFGVAGMLLALPTIVVFKVTIEKLFYELKAYRII